MTLDQNVLREYVRVFVVDARKLHSVQRIAFLGKVWNIALLNTALT